jgi:hypothetical protein
MFVKDFCKRFKKFKSRRFNQSPKSSPKSSPVFTVCLFSLSDCGAQTWVSFNVKGQLTFLLDINKW